MKLDLPFPCGVLDRHRAASQPIDVSTIDWRVVQLPKFVFESARGLFLNNRNDRLHACELFRMQVDDESVGRERRVLQRLEVVPHVLENSIDEVARGSPGCRCGLGAHRRLGGFGRDSTDEHARTHEDRTRRLTIRSGTVQVREIWTEGYLTSVRTTRISPARTNPSCCLATNSSVAGSCCS